MKDDSAGSHEPSAGDPEAEGLPVRVWLAAVSEPGWIWYAKRLSANDTLANNAHQAGPYVPKELVRLAFPAVTAQYETRKNPDAWFSFALDSHDVRRDVRLIWYNNRVVEEDGTRDEARVTRFGGRGSPILDPESTGSLCVFAFQLEHGKNSPFCRAWLCSGNAEAMAVEDVTGPIEPGEGLVHSPSGLLPAGAAPRDRACWLTEATMPKSWVVAFPSASDIVDMAVRNMVAVRSEPTPADKRLLVRRDCEYEIFRSVEEAHVLPRLREGFRSVDAFVAHANAVTNRRKSRSGASLELHAHQIFLEDGLPHVRGATTEGRKRPDFLFPSAEAYHERKYPADKLRVLAAKTTCKDRWRQILNEADRIKSRHLLTLQEGVSSNQWKEMKKEGVVLVVPKGLHRKYPASVRPQLMTLDMFIAETARLVGA